MRMFRGLWNHRLRFHSQIFYYHFPAHAYLLECICGKVWFEGENE